MSHRHSFNKMNLYGQKNSQTITVGTTSLSRYLTRPVKFSGESTSKVLCIDDRQTGGHYGIVIQRVDFHQTCTPIENGVVRFTEKNNAPGTSGNIKLRTPAFYRKLEDGDEFDGIQEANMAPWAANNLSEAGFQAKEDDFRVRGKFASTEEPWILCMSIKPSRIAGAKSLENQFSYKGPDAMLTTVNNIDAFATQLGIDVAQSTELKRKTKDSAIHTLMEHRFMQEFGADKKINAVVYVTHGPVHYDNANLTVRDSGDIADIAKDGPRILFTKRTEFAGEQEYRFAVSDSRRQTSDTISFSVSPELSQLTKSWQYGDMWWPT